MKKFLLNYVGIILLVAIIVTYLLIFRTAEVDGTSMAPTYDNGDLLLLFRSQSPKNGDIVAIYNSHLRGLLCKRVIGVAGDHVVVDEQGLSLNGVAVEESYVSTSDWFMTSTSVDLVVPDDEVFVMGDNRIASNDSRQLGCMATNDIVGVVVINATKFCGIDRKLLVKIVAILISVSVVWIYLEHRFKKDNGIVE